MALSERIRTLRTEAGLSLEDLATKASVSKTYLWELEKDADGTKKPSADILLRLANALSTTIADLLSLPSVHAQAESIQLPSSLVEFSKRMRAQGTPLSDPDLRDLAMMRFRGGQPRTADEWTQ